VKDNGCILIDRVDDVVVSCSVGNVMPEDIDRLLESLLAAETHVYIAGASGDVGIDSASRNRLFDTLKKHSIRVIGVTDSKLVKGILTAASWMGVQVRGLSWADLASEKSDPALRDSSLRCLLDMRRRCEDKNAPS